MNNAPPRVAIVDIGLATPLGLNRTITAAEMAAGTLRFVETETLDLAGEPVRACRLPLIDPQAPRAARVSALAREALAPLVEVLESSPPASLPSFLALPDPEIGKELLDSLSGLAPLELKGLFIGGRASWFQALHAALAELFGPKPPALVLVGASDSFCDPDSLAELARRNRVLGAQNRDGLLPGEGAGMMLLARSDLAPAWPRPLLGHVLGAELGEEPIPFLSGEPSPAEGLSRVFRALRQKSAIGERRVDVVLAGQTSEMFWARELSYAYLRNAPLMPEPRSVELAAASFGDLGAAAGAVQVGATLEQWSRAAGRGALPRRALAYGCSDEGQVGACVVEEASA